MEDLNQNLNPNPPEIEPTIESPYAGPLVPIEGTVVNWERLVQVNPETGACFEMDGTPIDEKETRHA